MNPVQPPNVLCLAIAISGRINSPVNPAQYENAYIPSDVKLLGKFKLPVNPEQYRKTP